MKALKGSLIIILLLAVSVGIGFGFQFFTTLYEKTTHPLQYTEFVNQYSAQYGVPPEIIYSVIKVESSFRTDAVSSAGAVGLMQITPDTFSWLQTKSGETLDIGMLYDPQTNIKYGTYFLSLLHTEFGYWDIVFAAYNAGRARVQGWMQNSNYFNSDTHQFVYIPYPETRQHIVKIDASIGIYKKLYDLSGTS